MARFPASSQVCYVPDIKAYVELVQADCDTDPYFMLVDDLVWARHLGTVEVCSWSRKRLRPCTPLARTMYANLSASAALARAARGVQ